MSLCVCNPTCSLRGTAGQAIAHRDRPRPALVGSDPACCRCHRRRRTDRCNRRRRRAHRGVLDVLLPGLSLRCGCCFEQGSFHRDGPTSVAALRCGADRAHAHRQGQQHRTARHRDQHRVPVGQPLSDHVGRNRRRADNRRFPVLPAQSASHRACALDPLPPLGDRHSRILCGCHARTIRARDRASPQSLGRARPRAPASPRPRGGRTARLPKRSPARTDRRRSPAAAPEKPTAAQGRSHAPTAYASPSAGQQTDSRRRLPVVRSPPGARAQSVAQA